MKDCKRCFKLITGRGSFAHYCLDCLPIVTRLNDIKKKLSKRKEKSRLLRLSYGVRICEYCGISYSPIMPNQKFCIRAHQLENAIIVRHLKDKSC